MSIIRMQNLQPQKINVPWYRINPFLLQSNLLYLGLRSRLTTPVQNSCKARNMQKVNEKSQVSPKHRQTITIHSPKEVSLLRKTTTSKANLPLQSLPHTVQAGGRLQSRTEVSALCTVKIQINNETWGSLTTNYDITSLFDWIEAARKRIREVLC